jgi:hypothetical protein
MILKQTNGGQEKGNAAASPSSTIGIAAAVAEQTVLNCSHP